MKTRSVAAVSIAAIVALLAATVVIGGCTRDLGGSDPQGDGPDVSPTVDVPGTPTRAETGSQERKPIEQVKAEWEARLLAIPGVTGVGIGLTKDRGETAIKVYVTRRASIKDIPTEIEGYPVQVERRGLFRSR